MCSNRCKTLKYINKHSARATDSRTRFKQCRTFAPVFPSVDVLTTTDRQGKRERMPFMVEVLLLQRGFVMIYLVTMTLSFDKCDRDLKKTRAYLPREY